jgi:uncharacterized protein YggU (UPF0235/DUF167 family)
MRERESTADVKPEASNGPWWRVSSSNGPVLLRIRLTPKASADRIKGVVATPDGPALGISVRALPSEGAANKAMIATVAKWLRCPKSTISLAAGAKGRTKTLQLEPLPATLEALQQKCPARPARPAS